MTSMPVTAPGPFSTAPSKIYQLCNVKTLRQASISKSVWNIRAANMSNVLDIVLVDI